MGTVASVNYATRRIYLSIDTVGVPLDTMEVYRDVRELRRTNEAHQAYRPIIVGGGNVQKTATTFTQSYVQLLFGAAIVPYNVSQSLVIIRDTFSDDGRAGVECFDRSSTSAEIDLDYQINPVEIREVSTGGAAGPTAAEIANAVWAKVLA